MSRYRIIPRLFSNGWKTLERSHRPLDQHFVMPRYSDPFKLMTMFDRMFDRRFENMIRETENFFRQPWSEFLREYENERLSVKNDKDKFHIFLDVQDFKDNEVNVKVIDNFVIVEGKCEKKGDEHGYMSRHFVEKYMIPEQCDPAKVTSTISSDGVLTITVAKKPEAIEETKERVINVQHIGKSAVEDEPEVKQAARE